MAHFRGGEYVFFTLMKLINKRAKYEYHLLERFEAGIVLTGAEVKSLRRKQLSFKDSFIRITGGEAWWVNAYINPYGPAGDPDYDPRRSRKLLLHQKQLEYLARKNREKGLTIVPTACYNKGHQLKLGIALAKGKKEYQKREAIKKRDIEREVQREVKGR